MKDSIIIHGSKEKVFCYLKKSILDDIKRNGINMDEGELKEGYKYSKKTLTKDNKTYTFHVTISRFEEPTIYESTILQGSIKYVTKYELKENNNDVEVTYTERIFNDKGREANSIFNWLLFAFKKKQLKTLLMQFKEVVEKGE